MVLFIHAIVFFYALAGCVLFLRGAIRGMPAGCHKIKVLKIN